MLSGGLVQFFADDGAIGCEPWVFDPGATSQEVGDGCADISRPILESGDPVIGGVTTLRMRGIAPGRVGALLIGVEARAFPLPGWSFMAFFALVPVGVLAMRTRRLWTLAWTSYVVFVAWWVLRVVWLRHVGPIA